MVERKQVLSYTFYTYGKAFTGSDKGIRYRIQMKKRKEGEGENEHEVKYLQTNVWKEPFSFEKTPKEEILERISGFSPEEVDAAVAWINEKREELMGKEEGAGETGAD